MSYSKQGRAHIRLHVLVIQRHDLHQVLQGCHAYLETAQLSHPTTPAHPPSVRDVTHPGVWTLCGFTHHLHDEVTLHLKHNHTGPVTQTTERSEALLHHDTRTSFAKLALVNSRELSRALVAASLTLLLGSSFLIPWMIAVRIWLALSCSCSGS